MKVVEDKINSAHFHPPLNQLNFLILRRHEFISIQSFFLSFLLEFSDSKQGLEAVAAFYKFWSGYTTYKSFCWCDTYNLSEAQNRWVKR